MPEADIKKILEITKHKSQAYKFGFIDGFDYYEKILKEFVCKGYESEIDNLDAKEDWCPLRPMPDKFEMPKEYTSPMFMNLLYRGEVKGRNDLIDELLGETE